MGNNFFFYAIVGISVAATMSYLNKATVKHVDSNENGEFLLRINKLYNIVGYAALVTGLVVITGLVLTQKLNFSMYIMVFLLFLIFIGLGSLCVLNYRNHPCVLIIQKLSSEALSEKPRRCIGTRLKVQTLIVYQGL